MLLLSNLRYAACAMKLYFLNAQTNEIILEKLSLIFKGVIFQYKNYEHRECTAASRQLD